MDDAALSAQIDAELERAVWARRGGNEGQARVCARRAAGLALRQYAQLRQLPLPVSRSAYDTLEALRASPALPPGAREVIDHLLLRVDTQFNLPQDIDLLAETHWLVQALQNSR